MDRRTFFKTAGVGGAAFLAGCNAHPERHLFSMVKAPADMVTGQGLWYASTCRECSAGCGVLAKNREGRVIKLEGNPLHPINQGKLCARGQAALQGLYSPDRLSTPLLKKDDRWTAISFEQAQALVRVKMEAAGANGAGRVAMLTEVIGDCFLTLANSVLAHYGSPAPLMFEPLAFESLKYAHQQVFGSAVLPGYHLDQATVIVGFGADFLETWLSPVAYSRKFKASHALNGRHKGFYCHVGAVQSLTAANADQWLACPPGAEAIVAMGILNTILGKGRGQALPPAVRPALVDLAAAYPIERVTQQTGLSGEDIRQLARKLLATRRPLVMPTGGTGSGKGAAAADLAVVWLNAVLDPNLALYDFHQRHRVEMAHPRGAINGFWQDILATPPDLLLLNKTNPLYHLPTDIPVARAIANDRMFTVTFTDVLDETAAASDLVFPVQHPLLTWDSYEGHTSLISMMQPTMGVLSEAPALGDVFLQCLPQGPSQSADYQQYLRRHLHRAGRGATDEAWLTLLRQGGHFPAPPEVARPPVIQPQGVVALAQALARLPEPNSDGLTIQVFPSLRHNDGRSVDRSWLLEIPDPVTQVAWQTVGQVHPTLLAAKGWVPGQVVEIATAHGRIQLPLYSHPGLHPHVLAVAMGLGHTPTGRYTRNQGVNPLALLSGTVDPLTGGPGLVADVTGVHPMGEPVALAQTSGSRIQHGRKIALSMSLDETGRHQTAAQGLTMADFPFTPPLPKGYDHSRDIYPAHDHEGYRWGMVVDLDRCIGCSACVAACYAENNLGVVGPAQMIKGREMAWLRIERYQDPEDPARLIFLPMMCQHCDNAPCESVCPVYAPHHSKEGLNNQIYNRCIGTRFCAQNCPYKVRRFNWLAWEWPAPLDLQLNPDVTVRSKGVMEKCSFCIQRIKEGHNRAKNETRTIRDGEVVPACAQTCPTDAIVFGDLMNPQSKVRHLMADPRAYQVLGYLNTKPAVIYLKKVVQAI